MKKLTICNRIILLLKEYGPLQVVKIAELLNKESSIYGEITRNTTGTILYTNKDKFEKIGWGLFDLKVGSIRDIKEEMLRKFIKYWKDYSNDIKFIFSDEELKIIGEYRKLEDK